jgi:PAS domain S-box-containing protein
MTIPSDPDKPSLSPGVPSPDQVEDLLSSPVMAKAAENDDFKRFLDYLPIAIVISSGSEDQQRIVYANEAFEILTGLSAGEVEGKSWQVLDDFVHEDDPAQPLGAAAARGEDLLGIFGKRSDGRHVLAQAYASVIEDEHGAENYRIAALVDVSDRERSQREEFERQIRDKDILLKELQHRVKNNLQLITALIRLEARAAQRGDRVDMQRLAGRVEALSLLYQALSTDHWGPVIDLGPYLSEIASASLRAHGGSGISLDLKMSYSPVSINVAMPAGLLINELLMNAFKYAFTGRDRGKLTLECRREGDDRYRIVCADDGAGFPPGTTWPQRGKLGALIVQTLRENTRELKLDLQTGPGEGARVTIDFVYRPGLNRMS